MEISKIIIKTALILLVTISISFVMEYLFFYLSNTFFLDYYQSFFNNFIVEPLYFALIVTTYSIINQKIFRINRSKVFYYLLFGSYFLLQVALQSIDMAFIFVIPIVHLILFYLIYDGFILKKNILKSYILAALTIIISNLIYNIFIPDYGHFFFASCYSFIGIFHFFYIIFNRRELLELETTK